MTKKIICYGKLSVNREKSSGFTLAEVLITLGVIGVVAAMTMPALMQHNKKVETTARLKKFYSIMSQAIMMSELDHGDSLTWNKAQADLKDDEGNRDYEGQANASWEYWSTYLAPYIKYNKAEKGVYDSENPDKYFETKVYFADGSTMTMHNGGVIDLKFDVNGDKNPNTVGRDRFTFGINNSRSHSSYLGNKKFGGIYQATWDRNTALSHCKTNPGYCTTLLIFDNFEFKDDYPYKL